MILGPTHSCLDMARLTQGQVCPPATAEWLHDLLLTPVTMSHMLSVPAPTFPWSAGSTASMAVEDAVSKCSDGLLLHMAATGNAPRGPFAAHWAVPVSPCLPVVLLVRPDVQA